MVRNRNQKSSGFATKDLKNTIGNPLNIENPSEKSKYKISSNEQPLSLEEVDEKIETKIGKAKEEFLREAKDEIGKQIQTDKTSLITVFGIFASITSFLTIEFQFLKTICSFEKLLGFTLILTSLLLCFNLSLDYLIKSRTNTLTPKPSLFFNILLVALFIFGISFSFLGNEEICKDNAIYEKYSESFKNEQKEINKNFANEQNKKTKEMQNKIEEIEKLLKNQ